MKIAVLVSGGVDSSVALALLKEQGHDVTAFYLKIWLEDELAFLGNCPWEEDLAYVRQVCEQLEVPLEIVPLQKEYHERVVWYAIEEVKAGRTPNPDIFCNTRVKFGVFYDCIDASYAKVATGHYARVSYTNGLYQLRTAPDLVKDQTYFLAHLSQGQLARALFPIGQYEKKEVRALAQKYDLPNKDRKDSQGICFLGKLKFAEFVKHHLGERPGRLVEAETGKVVGTHKGFWFYTIGQRQGIGLSGGPWYVVNKSPEDNIVFISRHYFEEEKKRNAFIVAPPHWIAGAPPEKTDLQVKLRHGPQRYRCRVALQQRGEYKVTLPERDQGIAPGQFAVFYDDTVCLGAAMMKQGLSV